MMWKLLFLSNEKLHSCSPYLDVCVCDTSSRRLIDSPPNRCGTWSFEPRPPGSPRSVKQTRWNNVWLLCDPGSGSERTQSDSWVTLTTESFSTFLSSRITFDTFYWKLWMSSSVQFCRDVKGLSICSGLGFSLLLSVVWFLVSLSSLISLEIERI